MKSIRDQLALASTALLQTGVAAAADDWQIDSAVLFYQEADSRVSAIEPVINGKKEIGEGETVNLKLVLDALTGATPNGAHASSVEQTFTTPSGKSSYTTAPGDTPIDDTFRDSRVAISGSWEKPVIDDYTRMILSGNISNEYDYRSLGVAASLLRDYNNRNTTVSASIGFNADSIEPEGGLPIAFSNMRVANSGTNRDGSSDSKTISDVLFGVTQVIDRKTLMQFNLGFSSTSGYMNDPFKVLTVVDPVTGLPITPADSNDLPYLYENRPDSRSRTTFYWKMVRHLTEDVIHLSYRYHTDDWGVDSHTLDFKYRYEMDNGHYFEPHLRYYTQAAADFFTTSLVDGEPLPEYASADYRLGDFTTQTLGFKYAIPMGENSEFSVRIESINQAQNDVGTPIGDQQNHQLTPDLDSFILQFGYNFRF